MRFTDAVVALHPAIVTIVFLLLFGGGALALMMPIPGIFAIVMLAQIGPLFLWHYSLYRAASARTVELLGHGGRRAIFFVISIAATVAGLVVPLLPASTAQAPVVGWIMPLMVLPYFAGVWAAANALTRFDEQQRSVELHKTLGTFFLEFYLFIGIWVIYPRIKRMLAAPVQT